MQDAVAIKIFTDPAGFANEERAYGIKALAEAVGTTPTFMKNEDRSAVMPNGWPFPPFTVAEKGQPLDVWMRSYSADPITGMQVLGLTASWIDAMRHASCLRCATYCRAAAHCHTEGSVRLGTYPVVDNDVDVLLEA